MDLVAEDILDHFRHLTVADRRANLDLTVLNSKHFFRAHEAPSWPNNPQMLADSTPSALTSTRTYASHARKIPLTVTSKASVFSELQCTPWLILEDKSDIPRTKEETSARAEMETSPTGVFRFSELLNGLRSAAAVTEMSDNEDAPPRRAVAPRQPVQRLNFINLCGLRVGKVHASKDPEDTGKTVFAMLTADDNIQYRIDGGRLVAVDQIAWFTTYNHVSIMYRLKLHRKLADIFKTAWILHVIANAEIHQMEKDIRLLDVGFAICGDLGLLGGIPPIPGALNVLPPDFRTKRDAAVRAFDQFKAAYPDVGAQINQFSVARAAGYLKTFETDFVQGFFEFDENDAFRLDIYVIRACMHFWAAPKPGRANGHAKRLYYDIDHGLKRLAADLSEQVEDRKKLAKPRWMTKQWLEDHEPFFTSKEEILGLWILSPIFSTLYRRAPEDPRDARRAYTNSTTVGFTDTVNPELQARADGESTLYLGPMIPLPDWRDAIKDYLQPGEVLEEP
ncbi:hypothetical protein SLS55_000188 [Diplodia seriata]|uniref:Fungal-type protein kinase domain-containing protein n=1 Tax=Diplodia seriata TaxID=420778 RepID=A0ABR3CTL7_9PEZI